MAGIALLSACSGGTGDSTPSDGGNPTADPSASVSPSPTITYAPSDPNYPDVPMRSESDLNPSQIGEGWFLVEYSRPDEATPTVNFLIAPDGELYRTTTHVFPSDAVFVLWLGDEYLYTRVTEESEYDAPTGDIVRGVFSTGSTEIVANDILVGNLLQSLADGYVLMLIGGEDWQVLETVSPSGVVNEGDSMAFDEVASSFSPDGTRRVVFANDSNGASDVLVEMMDGRSTKVADLKYDPWTYDIVGWKDEDELYFYRADDPEADSRTPRADFILNVDTGDVTETALPLADDVRRFELVSDTGVYFSSTTVLTSAGWDIDLFLYRADGSNLRSYSCSDPCFMVVSGNSVVFRKGNSGWAGGYTMTFIDLISEEIVTEIEALPGEWFSIYPYDGTSWY